MKYNIRFKGLWLLVLLATGFTTSFAQLSKMQFEDAEVAFSEGKFADAIQLLDAAEKSNKGVNPPIIHLRIMCRVELIRLNPENDFGIIDKARKETDFFLKEYDGDARLEEKYRDVYKASKVLKDLPLTQEQFDENVRNKKEAAATAEMVRKEKLQRFLSYSFIKDFSRGYTLEEFKKKNKLKDKHIPSWLNGDRKFYNTAAPAHYIVFRKNKVIGYEMSNRIDDNQAHEKGNRSLTEKIAAFKELFGFEPEIATKKYNLSTHSDATYTWKYQHKTFIMESYFFISEGKYRSAIYYYDYDESYIQS